MSEIIVDSKLKRFKIGDVDIILEDFEVGRGKIIVSDNYDHNYSYFWGSMGKNTDISKFLTEINSSYFASNLLPHHDERVIDIKATFKNLRKFIAEELNMPYYKEMEFQKHMREKINDFKRSCEDWGGKHTFVYSFHSNFINDLDFYLIDDRFDRDDIRRNFEGIDEVWHFLEEKPSENYYWLERLHKLIIKELKKQKKELVN